MARGEAESRKAGVAVAVGLLLALGVASCHRMVVTPASNRPPGIRLTGGPVAGDSVSYTAEFFWSGWDADGVIDHYQYAIDIPDDRLDRLNDPGPSGIAWRDTTAFRASFLFRTPEQDSVIAPDGQIIIPERYRGNHTFYVRAVDNEGAFSAADYVAFTARNITPRTLLTWPPGIKTQSMFKAGRRLIVAWHGVDPDSPRPDQRPAGYEWKLVPGINPATVNPQYELTQGAGSRLPWTRIGADTTSLHLNLNPPEEYLFVVRAIDEAGGVEHNYESGRNVLVITSCSRCTDTPLITLRERGLGSFTFSDVLVTEYEIPTGIWIRFEMIGNADAYGGEVQGFNYGLDVPDPSQDGPESPFHGWTKERFTEYFHFAGRGTHALTVKCRDTGGGVSTVLLILKVIDFQRDREALYIDDYRLGRMGKVSDRTMDAQVRDMLVGAGIAPSDLAQLDTWGEDDALAVPRVLRLSDLARYRMIVWSGWGAGYGGANTLVSANACATGRVLQTFVAAGGSLWLYGQQLAGCFHTYQDECISDLAYDEVNGLDVEPDNFLCQFVGLCGGDIRDVALHPRDNGLVRAVPTAEAARENFPELELDPAVFDTRIGGIPFVDAAFQPIDDLTGGLDTLYTCVAVKPNSPFNRKPCAFRYEDRALPPPGGPGVGRVAVFFFPLHLLKPGSTSDSTGVNQAAASLLAWFRRERGGVGGS